MRRFLRLSKLTRLTRLTRLTWLPLLAFAAVPVACGGDDGAAPTTGPVVDDAGTDASDPATATDAGVDATSNEADAAADATESADANDPTFILTGTATYDYVNANDDVTQGGIMLDYGAKTARPIRRASVLAMEGGVVLAETLTDDLGAFKIAVPKGHTATLHVAAKSVVKANVADGAAPDHCVGASWDLKVVDNTQSDAQYMLADATPRSAAATGIALNAPLVYASGAYTKRAAAPFAILDTLITEIELVCEGEKAVTLPSLVVKWSINNVPSGDNAATGEIGTSHYTRDPVSMQSELRILGKEDVDTDEYDDHVIAHEFGHYLEDRLFRSDSVGGTHTDNDILDPAVAFGEGWGNALSGMTFNDPIYVDTSGVGQSGGSTIAVNQAPQGDDRGLYSEASVQYLLWSLFDNRSTGKGSIDRIFNVFSGFQKTTPGLTSALTFAAYYNQLYGGSAESLKTLWGTALATPYNALCVGTCIGTGDKADAFDTDNDVGKAYATARKYPGTTGAALDAEFWRQSRLLVDGTSTANGHDVTNFGGYTTSQNKLGAQRAYRYVSTVAAPVTISVGDLGASACTTDVLDLKVRLAGVTVASDEETTGATAGCPSATFTTVANATYAIIVNGVTTELPSFAVTVARKHGAPFTVTSVGSGSGYVPVAAGADVALPIIVTPTRDASQMSVSIRGIDGVSLSGPAVHSTFLSRARGVSSAHPTIARLSGGRAGWVVVDVSAVVNGRRVSASYPLPLRASKAALAPQALGTLATNANGDRVELLAAVVR